MEILILNALRTEKKDYKIIRSILQDQLQADQYNCEWINVRKLNINICNGSGCLACQFNTPGLCVQKDDMQKLYPKLVQARLLVLITPVSFGSYHSELKKIVDRLLPLKVPVYTVYQGELHHKNRYKEMLDLFSIGFLKEKIQEAGRIFVRLTERNAINMFIENSASAVIEQDTDSGELQAEIACKLKGLIN